MDELNLTVEEPKRKRTVKKEETVELKPIQGSYCPNCQSKIRTDKENKPLCPLALTQCPRHQST